MSKLESRLQKLEQRRKPTPQGERIDRVLFVVVDANGNPAPDDDPRNVAVDIPPLTMAWRNCRRPD